MESPFNFSETRPLRWGVIGCGGVAEKKSVPAYQMTSGFMVHSVMRRDAEKAKDYAERHKIPYWSSDASEVIENPEIDAVYIATPPDSHKHYALQVASVGKPCCIEKPMAPCYSDANEILQAFEERNIPLFVAYYRRSLPRFLMVKQWLEEKAIGEVQRVCWRKTKQPNDIDLSGTYNWRTDKKVAPGGYFDDLASHGLDLFAFLFEDVVEAEGTAANNLGLYSAFDFVSGSWMHKNGVSGEGVWDFTSDFRSDEVQVFGSGGKIKFSVLDEAPLSLETETGVQKVHIENPPHIQQYHVENIKKHLLGIGLHPSTGRSGARTNWVMDKILRNS